MAGISDPPFRRLCRSYGAGLLYTECISAEGTRRMGQKSLNLAFFHKEERPIAVQLFGQEPRQFADAAAVMMDKFAPDMIDVNCGCPVKKFVTKKCGGWLMQYPDQVGKIVEAIRKSVDIPVSVKLRRGYMPGDETAPLAAQAAEEAGATLVAVHGRYVRKARDTNAEWDSIGRVKDAVKSIPVVGNGDVMSQEDAIRMRSQTGCDRVMIARGIYGKPYMFSGLHNDLPVLEPEWEEKLDIMLRHYALMMEDFSERVTVHRMRKHFGWYTHGMPGSAKLRGTVMAIEPYEEVVELVMAYRENLLRRN